jgi:hypothetical protein
MRPRGTGRVEAKDTRRMFAMQKTTRLTKMEVSCRHKIGTLLY